MEGNTRVLGKSYYNVNRFEYQVLNKAYYKERKYKIRKKLYIFDILLFVAVIVVGVVFLLYGFIFVSNRANIFIKNQVKSNLVIQIDSIKEENVKLKNALRQSIDLEDLKINAKLKHNMITPTDSSIIYFTKTQMNEKK